MSLNGKYFHDNKESNKAHCGSGKWKLTFFPKEIPVFTEKSTVIVLTKAKILYNSINSDVFRDVYIPYLFTGFSPCNTNELTLFSFV